MARKLPQELVEEIDKLVDWPIELEEALAHRLESMRVRKFLLAKRTRICLSGRSTYASTNKNVAVSMKERLGCSV